MLVDNFKAIREHLEFRTLDDYYFLEILHRKKDFPPELQDQIRDHRTIATYFVDSLEKFDRIEKEVKLLCKFHNARAYFNMNRKSKKKTTMQLMNLCLNMIENDDFSKLYSKTASAAGQIQGDKQSRTFLIDVDEKSRDKIVKVLELIEAVNPDTLHFVLSSVNGYHIITTPFDVQKFNNLGGKDLQNVEIKHNSPTILYYEKD